MTRSDFLRQLGWLSGGAAFGLSGLPVRAFAQNPLRNVVNTNVVGGQHNVVVLVQLSGGNDGLNTVVPFRNDVYYRKRPTLALPKDKLLPLTDELGLHPALAPLRSLYDQQQLSIVQNVGYDNPNRSHFRSTDIWLSASDATQELTDGWVGRYLTKRYPNYPVTLPSQPMAVQIGSVESMLTQSAVGSMGTVFENPGAFYQLVRGSSADTNPLPTTLAGEELKFLRQVAAQSMQYAEVIRKKADAGRNVVTYPNTNLGRQLAIVAELIAGGLETPVYLTGLGGFDTHANQLVASNVVNGAHATLLRTLAEAVAAFQKDLATQGLADRVTLLTFSEFGRRVGQNGTTGTDHGTAAPLFVVGSTLRGGLVGKAPNLTDLDANGDLKFTHDFRQVYATVLRDHLGAEAATLTDVLGRDFSRLALYRRSVVPLDEQTEVVLAQPAPNPFAGETTVAYSVTRAQSVRLSLYDLQGRELRLLDEGPREAGTHYVAVSGHGLVPGLYLCGLQTATARRVVRLIKV